MLSRSVVFAVFLLSAFFLYKGVSHSVLAVAKETPEGMVWIPEGSYQRGCADCGLKDALPLHRVRMSGFWIKATPVTNAEFKRFIAATNHVTVAEQTPDPKDYPGVPKGKLVPGSAVFTPPPQSVPLSNPYAWWRYQPGANWRHPEGPGSDVEKRLDHPAVHIAFADAEAYCAWKKQRLPTEAEFEFAARGGLEGKKFSWGDDLQPQGRWLANIWQGHFPDANQAEDGYVGTSPVRAFPPNAYGLYDMSGNVWQWVGDWYKSDYYQTLVDAQVDIENPHGPAKAEDLDEPDVPKRVQRGGSFLCSSGYCTRYLVASRGKGEPRSAGSNIGFRCVQNESMNFNESQADSTGGTTHDNHPLSDKNQNGAGGPGPHGHDPACHGSPGQERLFAEEAERSVHSAR